MADLVRPNDSIEGHKITGTSRKPVVFIRNEYINNIPICRFEVKFDVNASINKTIKKPSINPNASTNPNDKIICEKASIKTIKPKLSTKKQSNTSNTHSAFSWTFQKQTSVCVETPHSELMNAINNK